jgi:hypothetical protein
MRVCTGWVNERSLCAPLLPARDPDHDPNPFVPLGRKIRSRIMSMSRNRMRSIAQPDRAGFDETTELLIGVFALDISTRILHPRADPESKLVQ